MYFSYDHGECKITIKVSSDDELNRMKPIAEDVFNVDGVEVEIFKDYCEV